MKVREAVGDVLGELVKNHGETVYDQVRDEMISVVRDNLDKELESDQDITERMSGHQPGKLMNKEEWKKLSVWKDLDLSLECVAKMIRNLSSDVGVVKIDLDILELVFMCTGHQNRFVRNTGFSVMISMMSNIRHLDTDCSLVQSRDQVTGHLSSGLSDQWPQVRLSAVKTCVVYLRLLSQHHRESLFPALLPRLCLNRYYPAEGVKIQAQLGWRQITGDQGQSLVTTHLDSTLQLYYHTATSHDLAAREAACHSLRELSTKLDEQLMLPHIQTIMEVLWNCVKSQPREFSSVGVDRIQDWIVRDIASVATSFVIKRFPAEFQDKIDQFYKLYQDNMRWSDWEQLSVRQGAAISYHNLVEAYGEEVLDRLLADVREILEKYETVMKDRDSEPGDNYTENSSEEEGAVLTVTELSKHKQHQEKISQLLPLIQRCCHSRSKPISHFHITVVRCLTTMFTSLEKRWFKPHLDLEVILKCVAGHESEVEARTVGQQCLMTLSRVMGPRILRGRVENMNNPLYLSLHDKLIQC